MDYYRQNIHSITFYDSIIAIKFDSNLYGSQPECLSPGLDKYVNLIDTPCYPKALNNLCLISNWIFRREFYQK